MTASGNVKVQNKKSKMGMKAKEHIYQTILGFFLLLIALAMVVPFLYVIVISFTDASVYESESSCLAGKVVNSGL